MLKCGALQCIYVNSILWICFSLNIYWFKALHTSVTAVCFAVFEKKYAVIRFIEAEACLALMLVFVSERLLSQTFAALVGIIF